MGGGTWSATSFRTYSKGLGRSVDTTGFATTQNSYSARCLDKMLDPKNVIRECCDSEEHPNTVPVILALDVTGSMGSACEKTVASLNVIMTNLYKKYTDIEFLIMGIGDLAYDDAPIQASQFESDIRIAEQLDKMYLEKGGGGNRYESYTSAWYFGLNHTKLDCWKRGKKGVIITMGDEQLNPYLPYYSLSNVTGDSLQSNVETDSLYKEVIDKFDVFHISIDDTASSFRRNNSGGDVDESWKKVLGQNYIVSTIDGLPSKIEDCISSAIEQKVVANQTDGISW
jgi:hypothetical protein